MWVRVGSFLVKPDQIANLRRAYNDEAVGKVRVFPGNLGCLLLEPETDGDAFLVFPLWADRAAAEHYEASGLAAEVVALVRPFFASPPTLRSYASSTFLGLSPPAPPGE